MIVVLCVLAFKLYLIKYNIKKLFVWHQASLWSWSLISGPMVLLEVVIVRIIVAFIF